MLRPRVKKLRPGAVSETTPASQPGTDTPSQDQAVRMKRATLTPLVAAAFALGAPPMHAQDGPSAVGSWSGTLVAGPQQLEIIFHVTAADDGLTGTMDVPAQGATGIPLTTVTFTDGTLVMTFPVPGGGRYEGTVDDSGDTMSGTFTQGGQPFPMDITRGDGLPAPLDRPQEPLPPFPYQVEEVTFPNPAPAIELAGTLTLPDGSGPFPAAILVSGSGPQDRDETLMGHKPFKVIADHLTRHGIAVLRYDDRGVGASTGDFAAATSEDFAEDALAAVRFLEEDTRIRGDAIGIVGHSEGGLVGPMAAARSESVDYVVMLAGPGVTGLEVLVEQGRLINTASGAPPEMTAFNSRLQTRLAEVGVDNPDPDVAAPLMTAAIEEEIAALSGPTREMAAAALSPQAIEQTVQQMNSRWFRYFLHYDPRPALEATQVPVLALFGGKDLQVPPQQSADEVRAAFARSANRDATVTVLPGLNHLFQEADTGSPAEYQSITQTVSPVALDAVSDWIQHRFGPMASDS